MVPSLLFVVGCSGGDGAESATTTTGAVVTTEAPTTSTTEPVTTTQAPTTTTTTTPPHLFEQSPGTTGQLEAQTSVVPAAAGTRPTTVFDDFALDSDATVRTLSWHGIYCIDQEGAPSPEPTATGFVVAIYPDQDGQPQVGSPLWTEDFEAAVVAETFVDTRPDVGCSINRSTWDLYQYEATATAPLEAEAGVTYWLSVQAMTPSYEVYWGWRGATPETAGSFQLFNEEMRPLNFDRAFTLSD